jgi:hypothetical protein
MLPDHPTPEDAETQAITGLIRDFAARPGQRFYARQAAAPWNTQGEPMQTRSLRHRLLLVPAMLALLLALMAMSPALRALAADILGITRAETDTVTYDASRQALHGPEPRPIAEVQAETPYAIYAPAEVPPAYALEGASYNADMGNGVHLIGVDITYKAVADPDLSISISQLRVGDGCGDMCPDVGASAVVETVDINGVPGAYVQGAWTGSADLEANWDSGYDLHAVTWEADGFEFRVSAPRAVPRADLLTVARSMRP